MESKDIWISIWLIVILIVSISLCQSNETAVPANETLAGHGEPTSNSTLAPSEATPVGNWTTALPEADESTISSLSSNITSNATNNTTPHHDEDLGTVVEDLNATESRQVHSSSELKPVHPLARGFEVLLEFQYMIWSIFKYIIQTKLNMKMYKLYAIQNIIMYKTNFIMGNGLDQKLLSGASDPFIASMSSGFKGRSLSLWSRWEVYWIRFLEWLKRWQEWEINNDKCIIKKINSHMHHFYNNTKDGYWAQTTGFFGSMISTFRECIKWTD